MQQDASNPKQLIIERVRQSTNILVAVSANPSVDALAAALALALTLNKMDKHATAVFSGAMPPAMEFLNPGKTFEHSVDSLRDFIISLDKEKADRLRYKVEDDVVRIFITPYRTTISEKDLQFSQGDFNVDLIIGLGVEKREDLDKAIVAHGRILHDATVMTINADGRQSSLGAVDWHETNVSSLCEMLVSLTEGFQQPGLLDQQIATALLTGIVAATDRFSNEHTTPKVMTMSAQLMAAGANQQLIANNLIKATQISVAGAPSAGNGQLVPNGASIKVAPAEEAPAPKPDGELDITHGKKPEEPATAPAASQPVEPAPAPEQQQGKGKRSKKGKQQQQPTPEDELEAALPAARQPVGFDQLKEAISEATPEGLPSSMREHPAPGSQTVNGGDDEEDGPKAEPGFVVGSSSWRGRRLEPPALGGTLNATTEKAMDDTRAAEEAERNQKLLTHPDAPAAKKKQKGALPANQAKVESVAPVVAPTPVAEPEQPAPQPAPAAEPAPAPEVAEQPAPAPEPAPAPAEPVAEPEVPPMPPQPAAEPVPTPAPVEEPAPIAAPQPAPAPVEPALPEIDLPAPAPEAAPAPVEQPAPVAEPAEPPVSAPQPADPTGVDLDAARQAVTDALQTQPFNPAGQPLQSAGAMPLATDAAPAPVIEPVAPPAPDLSTLAPLPEPPAMPPVAPGVPELPPLPPMPPLPQADPNQPLPPPPSLNDLPPLPASIPPAPVAPPPEAPTPEVPPAPADPRQFKIPGA